MPSQIRMHPENCVHHWILGRPVRGIVEGLCKYCGVTKDMVGDLSVDIFKSRRTSNQRVQDAARKNYGVEQPCPSCGRMIRASGAMTNHRRSCESAAS